jgi:subtilisin family serine protease
MLRRLMLALFALVPLLAALASLPARAQAEDASRQLLVMLQLPKAHYRPDSSYAGSYGDGVGLQSRKLVAEALAHEHELQLLSEWPMPLAGVDCFVMRLPAGDARSPEQVAKAVAADRRVAWAQPVRVYRGQGTRDEPLYATQPAASQWRLAELHALATGRGVRVAVIDSGVEVRHPDLAGQVSVNENFVDGLPLQGESHGTAVAGIIAARADNRLGIAGIAPQARLLALRACWQDAASDTLCTSLSLAKALQAAVQRGAHIINLSLAGPDDRLLGALLDQALARGVAVVAALGSGTQAFPGNHPGVLAVGSAPPLPAGAVLAPGRDIPSPAVSGGWSLVSGSSFAAAHASGLLALVRELGGAASPARPLQAALVTGPAGRIDSCATLLRQAGAHPPACGPQALGHIPE